MAKLKNKYQLNTRQIIIHLIAAWFLMYAFQTLFSLHETKMINIYRHTDMNRILFEFDKQGITGTDLVNFRFWTNVGKTVGLLIAFLISLTISLKKGWFWQNSILVLILLYVLAWTKFLGLNFLQHLFYLRALTFLDINLLLIFLSIIFSFFAIIIFLHHKPNQYIQQSYQ